MAQRRDTKRVIAESFKELIKKNPIEKITVANITELSGVIRPTFYNHFSDKYEVLEYIIRNDLLLPIKPLLANDMIVEGVTLLMSNMNNEIDFYKNAVRIEGQNSFESVARQEVAKLLLEIMEERSGEAQHYKYRWLTREIVAEYYAQSITYVATSWIKQDYMITPKEISEIYDFLTHNNVIDVLKSL